MSDQDFERRVAKIYLENFETDPLLGLKDIRNYTPPNFIGDNGKLHIVRCYQCLGHEERGRGNYGPNVASGMCTWCGWKPNPEILSYIKAIRIVKQLPPKMGMTIEEIKERYPDQYEEALSQYTPEDQEDDGETD